MEEKEKTGQHRRSPRGRIACWRIARWRIARWPMRRHNCKSFYNTNRPGVRKEISSSSADPGHFERICSRLYQRKNEWYIDSVTSRSVCSCAPRSGIFKLLLTNKPMKSSAWGWRKRSHPMAAFPSSASRRCQQILYASPPAKKALFHQI